MPIIHIGSKLITKRGKMKTNQQRLYYLKNKTKVLKSKQQYYIDNKEKQYQCNVKSRKKRISFYRKVINRYKMLIGCQGSNCNYNKFVPEILQFDHLKRENKVKGVSNMISGNFNFFKIKDEIRKCQILCANCHTIKTKNNNDYI